MQSRLLLLASAVLMTCTPAAMPAITAPEAPSQLLAEEQGGGAHLTWKDNSSNEDEFEVWRQPSGGASQNVATVLFDARQYHDATISRGITYVYRVRAGNAAGPSSFSNEVTFTLSGGSGGGSAGGGSAGGGAGGSGGAGGGGGAGGAGGGSGGGSDVDAGSAPTCTVTAPVTGTTVPYDQQVTFVASANDAEDGSLSGGSVVWRTNLATAPLGTGLSLTRTLPVPGVHTVTCTATDSQGNTGVGSITITSQSPLALLNHPSDGEVRAAANPIPFIGNARDFEDGLIPDAGMVWTSSIDGMIGTGRTFNRTLSAGTNVVTLRVTDSNGNMATKSITLTITP